MTMTDRARSFAAWMLQRVRSETPTQDRIVYIQKTKAGTRVTPDTALTVSGFWAGVRAIAEPIGYLGWHVLERTGQGKTRRDDLPIDWMLDAQPNGEMSAGTFRETLLAHAIAWGNGYSEIERSGSGQPMALWPLPPDRVLPDRDSRGRLYYDVWPSSGPNVAMLPRDIFHLRGLGFDGIMGYSVVKLAAQSLGLSLAQELNAATFFGNGSQPGGVIKYPGKITEPTREETRKEWMKRHGGPANKHVPAVLDQGVTWESTAVPNNDAQMIESRKLSVTEVARWLRLPPHKLADLEHATFSNIEEQNLEYLTDSLMPWINRLEEEANIKLFGPGSQGRLFTRINVKTLLRGNTAAQQAFLTAMIDRGIFNVNESREYLDMDPIGPDGDKRFVPMNMQLLEKAGEEPEPAPAVPGAAGAEGEGDPGEDGANGEAEGGADEEVEGNEPTNGASVNRLDGKAARA